MNAKTNFYGFIGLASTLGKHASNIGHKVSKVNENICYYVHGASDKVLKGLETVSKKSSEFSEWTKGKYEEWETWANEKHEQAKRDEDWKQVNEKYKNVERGSRIRINLEEDVIECMIRPKKTTYLPSCLSSWRV